MARAGFDAVRRRAGAADARGDALAAGAGRRASVHRRRRRAGSICRRRTCASSSSSSPATRSWSACATSCRPSRTIGFCCGRRSGRGIAAARRVRPRLRHPYLSVAICRWRPSSSARFAGQRFVLDHLGEAGHPRRRDRAVGGATCARSRRCRTSGASCPGSSRRPTGAAWTPEQLRPYLDVAFDCFGADRLMIGSDWPVCTVAADYARTMAVVVDYLASRPARERDAVLGGNAAAVLNLMARVRRGPRMNSSDDHVERRDRETAEANQMSSRAVLCVLCGLRSNVVAASSSWRSARRRASVATAAARRRSPSSRRARRTSSGRAFTPARRRRRSELGVDDHLARTAARGRSRLAGVRGRGLRQPRRVRHRARAARRRGARAAGRRREARTASRSSSSTRG